MSARRTVVRLARRGVALWWAGARPSTGADLRSGRAVPRPLPDGHVPTPQERWTPSTVGTGAWAGVDPHRAAPWPSRGAVAGLVVWGGLVAVYARTVGADSARTEMTSTKES